MSVLGPSAAAAPNKKKKSHGPPIARLSLTTVACQSVSVPHCRAGQNIKRGWREHLLSFKADVFDQPVLDSPQPLQLFLRQLRFKSHLMIADDLSTKLLDEPEGTSPVGHAEVGLRYTRG